MHRQLACASASILLLTCVACASSTPPQRYGDVASRLSLADGSSQLLVYTRERAGAIISLDGRSLGTLFTAASDDCSFLFTDARPGPHRLALRMDHVPPGVDPDNVTPRDDRDVVLVAGERLELAVASERDLLFSQLRFVESQAEVPADCVYVGPVDALTRGDAAP